MRIVLLLIVFVACFSACKNKDSIPNGILPKDQMQSVLWDVIQADAYTNTRSNIKGDTLINPILEDAKLQEQIFNIHHISREDFYKSYAYYKEHTTLLMAVLDSMTAQGNRNENTRLALKAKATAKADSIKAKATAKNDSLNISGLKNKNLFLKQNLKTPVDSTSLKNKQKAALKAKQKKYLLRKHKLAAAVKTN